MSDKLFSVTFQPSNKSTSVSAGSLVLDALVQAGLSIETPCGGQGRCGRCLVKVEGGEVTHRENPRLTPKQLDEGWVLSCVARVAGDLVISVPARKERERVVLETATSRTAAPVHCDWPQFTTVRQISVELPPPSLQDNAPDLDRLQRVLAQKHGIEHLSVGLDLIRKLASTIRQGNWQLSLTLDIPGAPAVARLIDLQPGKARPQLLGMAVDIGTTNVVIDLVNLRTGRALSRVSTHNKQTARGEDVISRIVYSERGNGLEELRHMVVDTINELVSELVQKHSVSPQDIVQMVVAGNTTMIHLFLGLPAHNIRVEPYVPTVTQLLSPTAREVGVDINPNAEVYCVPSVAAYVGGDTTAGVLSSCMFKTDKLTLFLDVGTNGELVLGNSDWMTTCACSAGPAFEGAGVRNGMRAIKGAIEDIRINTKTLEPTIRVMGNVAPQGICGSGMISALAEMLVTGVVNRSGRIDVDYVSGKMPKSRARRGEHGGEYVMAWAKESGTGEDIVLTEVDINNLIRTKAAIYAGIAVMARSVGIPLGNIEEILIGGAFGQHINVEAAITIGLLPDLPWEKFKFLGNTSVWGAYNILLSKYARAQAEQIASKLTYLELVADNTFMNELTAALFLPHTDIDRFPSVKGQLEKNNR